MRKEDVKIGMKVKLLGRHYNRDNYNSLEEWLEDERFWKDKSDYKNEIEMMQQQGYGYVIFVEENYVHVTCDKDVFGWNFAYDDIEPYEEDEETIYNVLFSKEILQYMMGYIFGYLHDKEGMDKEVHNALRHEILDVYGVDIKDEFLL